MKSLFAYLAAAFCRWQLVFTGSGPAAILISTLLAGGAVFDLNQTIDAARVVTDSAIAQLKTIDADRVLLAVGEASMPFGSEGTAPRAP
jgi:hypothetical protein